MFTGIVTAIGTIAERRSTGDDLRLRITADASYFEASRPGDSIAVNGVCLTAVEQNAHSFLADVSAETLSCTTLGTLETGARVNLEHALALGDSLGGHLVSGHIDAVSSVVARSADGRSLRLQFSIPPQLAQFIAAKGNICIDGTSLTVNEVEPGRFGVNIVPHTLEHTIAGAYEAGTQVNLEIDLIARYVAHVIESSSGNRE